MATKSDVAPRMPKQGEKTIELNVRFWTDEIAGEKGAILPKHAWASGVVHATRNTSHGISPTDPIPFNSLMELPVAIEKTLLAHGIILHADGKMKKYFTAS
jgi:hypothetical protein